MIPALLAISIAIMGGIGFVSIRRLREQICALEDRMRLTDRALDQVRLAALPGESHPEPSPLAGMSILLAISQDHPRHVFEDILRERLLRLDAADVCLRSEKGNETEADLVIQGEILCNSYAEVYYSAELTCTSRFGTICSISERPAGGDRQENLAIEVLAKISERWVEISRREERRSALRELGQP